MGPICRHAFLPISSKSLREISDGLAVTCGKLNHLGLRAAPNKSTLSYANAHRPWQLYQNIFFQLRDFCREESPGKKKKFRFKNKLGWTPPNPQLELPF
ncbi:hypothetical protein ACFLYL_02145 [Chloroflexota bacterium]